MNHKEKAKELVEKFLPYMDQDRDATFKQRFTDAKQCALIVVEEIIIVIDNSNRIKSHYWQQVKGEIEKCCKENH